MIFQNSYWIITVTTFVILKAQNLKLIQIDIFFSCTIYQNIFTLPLTKSCFLLFSLPYYSVKSPNPCYYYCDCYFYCNNFCCYYIELALDVWFEKIQLSILMMVIIVCEKLSMKHAGIWYVFLEHFHCDTGE